MKYLIHVGKALILTSILGLVVACGDHPHEDDPKEKKEHSHSHSES